MSEVDLSEVVKITPDNFKPTLNRVLIQIVKESSTYGATGISKVDTNIQVEPYGYVISVGEQVKSCKENDIVLCDIPATFSLFGTEYALLTEMNIKAVISKDVADEFTNVIATKDRKAKLKI